MFFHSSPENGRRGSSPLPDTLAASVAGGAIGPTLDDPPLGARAGTSTNGAAPLARPRRVTGAEGTVANAAASPAGGGSALVELRLAALGDGELRLGSADGPALRRAALPYPVAVDAEAAA